MATQVTVPYAKSFDISADQKKTYDYFADLKTSLPKHFPGIDRFEQVKGDVYRWTFEKFGYGNYQLEIKLLTKVSFDAPNKITLSPVKESGASTIEGYWSFKADGAKTKVDMKLKLDLDLPVPFFLKSMAAPIAEKEITKLFDRYVKNVTQASIT